MTPQLRILLVVAFIIIIGAVAAVFLLGQGGDDPAPTPNATSAAVSTQQPRETPTPLPPTQELTEIIIAIQQIDRGAVIPAEAVRFQPWPVDAAPFDAVLSLEDVVGKIARTDIYSEQPILSRLLVENLTELADAGSDAAAVIPEGRVGVSIPMDRITSVAYAIQPGDRVDIAVSLLYVDIDDEFQSLLPNNINIFGVAIEESGIVLSPGENLDGRFETRSIPLPIFDSTTLTSRNAALSWPVLVRPRETPRPRLVTQRTVLDAAVIHVGDFPRDGRLFQDPPTPTPVVVEDTRTQQQQAQGQPLPPTPEPPRPSIVTLAVTPQEAVILTYMIESRIPITFFLRSASDTGRVLTDPVTLEYIMNEYNISVPPKTGFSIQPAIRSIRQLVADSDSRITIGN